jgi:hypothetical protein
VFTMSIIRTSGLARMLAVQPAGVLLQRSFPGNGHRQHEGIKRRVIESLADQLAGCQNDARLGRRQCVETRHRGERAQRKLKGCSDDRHVAIGKPMHRPFDDCVEIRARADAHSIELPKQCYQQACR